MDDFQKRLKDAEELYFLGGNQAAFPLESALSMFDTGLKLWLSKEKTKYVDKKIALTKEWYEEYSRPDRSRMALDNIDRQLKILMIAFMSAVSEENGE